MTDVSFLFGQKNYLLRSNPKRPLGLRKKAHSRLFRVKSGSGRKGKHWARGLPIVKVKEEEERTMKKRRKERSKKILNREETRTD